MYVPCITYRSFIGWAIEFVMHVYTGHVIWDDAVATSSPGYFWRECCYIRLCSHMVIN